VKFSHRKIDINTNQEYRECWEQIAGLHYDKKFHKQLIETKIREQKYGNKNKVDAGLVSPGRRDGGKGQIGAGGIGEV